MSIESLVLSKKRGLEKISQDLFYFNLTTQY